jgi:hypothetical protein
MLRRLAFGSIAIFVLVAPLGFWSSAGATVPGSGSVIPDAFQGGWPGPFDSGENANIVIPPNSAFAAPNNNSGVDIVECAAPDGVVPTQTTACDGNTLQIFGEVNSDGSFTDDGYTIYALPDLVSLDEPPNSPVTCGDTAADECDLYIGLDPNDFTQPHLWSEPFLVHEDPTDSGTINPGDGTPEVPLAVLLPLSAGGLFGGAVLIRRRRTPAPRS